MIELGRTDPGASQQPGPIPSWEPPVDWRSSTVIGRFAGWSGERHGFDVRTYDDLWQWSVRDLDGFWTAVWDYFGVTSSTAPGPALADASMPGARWFPSASVNYSRHLLQDADPELLHDDMVALTTYSQTRDDTELTFGELRDAVARARAGLLRLGVTRGDRVVAYLPNIAETVVAFLASASIGAVWASCAPEFGTRSVVDRFAQLGPTVLIGVTGYRYGDRSVNRLEDLSELRAQLPTLRHLVHVPYGEFDEAPDGALAWAELTGARAEPAYDDVPFDHPLCVLFSSGTTGLPKPIVHSHGGILLEHLKNHSLSWDLGPGDRLLWYTTTAWMMWNALVSALLVRAGIVLIDGNPLHPGPELQWDLAARTGTTLMGLSPGFIMATRQAGLEPAQLYDLSRVRQIGAAGSPLPREGYRWIAEQLPGVMLNVGSGGTDVCSGIVQGSPLQPVVEGEIAGPCLAVDACAYDQDGNVIVGQLGELVIRQPMPSMPVGFWGDDDGSRYRSSYFDDYPGVWRHGDFVRFSDTGTCVIAGRSDATLNRGGVRLGTAEFYNVVEELTDVEDSLVVHLEDEQGGMGRLVLFVVPSRPSRLTHDELVAVIRAEVRAALSPRHLPDEVVVVPVVPRNRTGKKLELPVKRILRGDRADQVASPGSLAQADALDAYVAYAVGHRS